MVDTKHTVSRGRPRCFDVDEGVAIAARLFRARGYDAVGVAELVAAIGISPPSFYAAYGSKRSLLARALERYATGEGRFLADAIASGGPLPATVASLFARAAEQFTADPQVAGCLLIEATRNCADPEARALAGDALATARERLTAWIAGSDPAHAAVLAEFVLVGLAGLSAQARAGASRASLLVSARILAAGFEAELDRAAAA